MQLRQRALKETDAETASQLIRRSFRALAAADWEPSARSTFLEEASPASVADAIGSCAYSQVSFVHAEMVGLILLRKLDNLTLLFVDPAYLRNGIATALWNSAREYLEVFHPEVRAIALNATPCAVPFYRSVGFLPSAPETTVKGCRFTPMLYQLSNKLKVRHAP